MMTERELIGEIRKLRQIKPNKDWVSLTKSQILPNPTFREWSFWNIFSPEKWWGAKPALATVTVFGILFGIFIFAQNSLPGDFLYPIKKTTERGQAVFVSKEELPKVQLELVNKRLEELNEIAQTNQVKKLAPAIQEFQASISEAAQKLAGAKEPNIKEIVTAAKKIEINKQKAETLGVVMGETEKLDNAYRPFAEREIQNLENSSLTEKQEEILKEAKEYFEKGDYSTALIKVVEASQVR